MKWWKPSDFKLAEKVVKEGLSKKQKIETIAKAVALKTKFDETKALKEVPVIAASIISKEAGTKDPLKNKIQRGARKFFWNLLDGGL